MMNIGDQFGELKVIGERDVTSRKNPQRVCQCICGSQKLYREAALLNGKSKRCASCAKTGDRNPIWKGCGQLSGWYWGKVLVGAKKRKLEISISIEDAWNKFQEQDHLCALSGIELIMASPGCKDGTASLDRIDSSKGYTIDNIQWVHKTINLMKHAMHQDEFVVWCNLVAGKNQ